MNITEVFQLTPLALGAIPVIVGLVQVIKGVGLPNKYAPVASIVLGVTILAIVGLAWQAFLIQGIIVGLSAAGLYSGSKAVFSPTA